MEHLSAENDINVRVTLFNAVGNLLLLTHTAANGDYHILASSLKALHSTDITVHPILRVLTHCAGVKEDEISLLGVIGQGVAHFNEHSLIVLGVAHVLLTTEGVDARFWLTVNQGG